MKDHNNNTYTVHTKQKKNNFDANRKCVSPMLHFMCNIVVAVVLCLCSHFLPFDSICFFSCRIKKWTKTINFVYRCCCFCCLCLGRWKNIFKNMMNGWEWLTSEKWKKKLQTKFHFNFGVSYAQWHISLFTIPLQTRATSLLDGIFRIFRRHNNIINNETRILSSENRHNNKTSAKYFQQTHINSARHIHSIIVVIRFDAIRHQVNSM